MVTYYQIIISAWIIFWVFLYVPLLFNRAQTDRRSSKYMKRTLIVVITAWIFMAFLEWYKPGSLSLRIIPDTAIAEITGVILTFTGLGFASYARIHLGRFWSNMVTIKVGHQLIMTGPYRFVRNPIYSGVLIAVIGAAIAIGVLVAFLVLGTIIVAIWVKISSEEEILLEKFGEEYMQYKKVVKAALIPFLL